jgi:hypothetical protein
MTLKHSWWDERKWMSHRGAKLNPYWPYTHRRVVFVPDFTNQVNRAEMYARSASGIGRLENQERLNEVSVLPIFTKYLGATVDGFEKGLKSYRRAALEAPEPKRAEAFKDVIVAEQIRRMLLSCKAVLEFEDLRFRLVHSDSESEKSRLLGRMVDILREEQVRTQASLEAALRDSRLGYKLVEDYVYSPSVLKKKLEVLAETLQEQIPDFRKMHRVP